MWFRFRSPQQDYRLGFAAKERERFFSVPPSTETDQMAGSRGSTWCVLPRLSPALETLPGLGDKDGVVQASVQGEDEGGRCDETPTKQNNFLFFLHKCPSYVQMRRVNVPSQAESVYK